MPEKTLSQGPKIGLFTLIMISAALVIAVRGFPTEAVTGYHMLFFCITAGLLFFLPVGLVSAELATGWPEEGGVYVWAKEAFGERIGFLCIWWQWFFMMLLSVAILFFLGGSLAYIFRPSLATNRPFLIAVLCLVIWGATIINLRGMKASSTMSTVGFLGGVLLPALLIILLGVVHLVQGKPVAFDMSFSLSSVVPDFREIGSFVMLLTFMMMFFGIEASASHAAEVRNPKRSFPIAIFVVLIINFLINIMGSLSVAAVVPAEEMSLISGLMEAFERFFGEFGLAWLVKPAAFLVVLGAIGQIITWCLGPIKGISADARQGGLPPFFQKENHRGVPVRLLVLQAGIITVVGCTLLVMPNLNSAFWAANALAVSVYMFMYGALMLSGIQLRYKRPEVPRSFRVPGRGNSGMWVICIACLGMILLAIGLAIIPPPELNFARPGQFAVLVVCTQVVTILLPLLIFHRRKPEWNISESLPEQGGEA